MLSWWLSVRAMYPRMFVRWVGCSRWFSGCLGWVQSLSSLCVMGPTRKALILYVTCPSGGSVGVGALAARAPTIYTWGELD